jgi:hypothetical protein
MKNCANSSACWNKWKPGNSVKVVLFLLGISLLTLLPFRVSDACGPGDIGFQGYTFVGPDLVQDTISTYPFLVSFEEIYTNYFSYSRNEQQKGNIEEWMIKVCRNALPADVKKLIYKSSKETLELLRTSTLSKNMPVPYQLGDNTFARYLHRNKCTETVDYLIYAKECEDHVTAPDPWNPPKRNKEAMQELIDEGKRQFKKANSHYLRLRYAYQIVRLAHYRGDYDQAVQLYDFLTPKYDLPLVEGQPSIIHYWLLAHKAGALKNLDRRAEAAYLFSQVFRHCPSKRSQAFTSFEIRNDKEWDQALLLCEDETERAMLYALRASARDSKAIEEMAEIYALDPKNIHLETLLVKEIKELEKDLLGLEFNNNARPNKRYFNRPRSFAGTYVITLQRFVRAIREEKKVLRPEFWHMAEGYLELLAGDYYAAGQTLREAAPSIPPGELRDQLEVFYLAQRIYGFDRINDSIENAAYEVRRNEWFDIYTDFPDFLRDRMTKLYQDFGEKGKAFRCQYTIRDLQLNPQEELIEDLLRVSAQLDKNNLEKMMTRNEQGKPIYNELLDMKALLFLQENQMEAAYETYKRIPRTQWDNFKKYDPFRPTVIDCLSCPHSKDTSDLFNRGEIIEELIDLDYKTKADQENKAIHFFRIGVGLYNMSYFGHSWAAMDYYRDPLSWKRLRLGEVQPKQGTPFGNKENLNVDRAKYYFDKARLSATNDNLAAMASFMAAKCEQIQYYLSEDYVKPPCCNNIPFPPPEYLTNFQRIVENYRETPFFEDIIEECLYFRLYALPDSEEPIESETAPEDQN